MCERNQKIFYNTHPAIIKQEVFDKVQEIRQQRHRKTATCKSSPFSGLVFCADCRQKLYYSTTNYFEKWQDFFICSTHRASKDKCSVKRKRSKRKRSKRKRSKRKQKVHIEYDLVGYIPVDELIKAEQA